MDRFLIEKLTKEIYKFRSEKKKIEIKEKELRNKLIKHLKENNLKFFKFGDFVIQHKSKYIKSLKEGLKLPESYYNKTIAYQLHIKKTQDIKLVGNKFVISKK